MRIGIIGLIHESNTFLARPTTLDDFRRDTLLEGEPIRARFAAAHHELGGFFAGLETETTGASETIEAAPIFVARAFPSGTISAAAWTELLARMFDALDRAGPLDGILVAPHGATVSEAFPDADGHWLGELRRRVGERLPIIGTLDPHANLSREMVAPCDALIAYRSNPHLDQRDRGIEAAHMMVATVRGEVRPVMRGAFPPLVINIERQQTGEPHLRPVYEFADRQLQTPGILSNSIVLGFPYADVAEMGSAAIAVADGDASLAARAAEEIAGELWTRRNDFVGQLIEVDAAIERCRSIAGPVCLLDMGDNVGGGSAADGTFLARALHQAGLPRSFVCLFDPEAVAQAEAAGVGATLRMSVGGKTDSQHGPPLTLDVAVASLHAGKFRESQPRHGGFVEFDQGRTAVVSTASGLTVMLTSRRMVPFSLEQLRSCGLEPADFHVLVAKGVHAPIAAYAEVCRELIRVNTGGSTCADLAKLEFHHRRRPLFPLEDAASQWTVSPPAG